MAAIIVGELGWEGDPVQESVDNALELADVVAFVITELVLQDDPLQFAEILADVFVVDASVVMADLIPVEVSVELTKVVTVNENVELAVVAANGGKNCGACGCGCTRNYRACLRGRPASIF